MPFKPDSTSGGAATRATKLTSVSSFKLYAYNSSGTAIADGVTYTKSGNSWNPDSKVFWPQTGNVTFYAFSPASNSSVSFNTSNKQLTYTAPTGESSQQDVLYAYKTSARPTNNTVDLTFNHANAAFSVNARLATGCTATVNVSGVQLVNVKPTNTLTFASGNTTASGNNISSTLACNAKTLTTSNQAISSSPLIIPPQSVTAWSGTSSLANSYLAVTCKVQANDNYVVGSASANGMVYVPMDKTLNKGEDNTVNLVFGSVGTNGRSYGRDENGNKITVPDGATTKDEITSADVGRVICADGSVYSTVSEATSAGKTAAGMIAYVSGQGHGIALALHDEAYEVDENGNYLEEYYVFSAPNDIDISHIILSLEDGWHIPSVEEWEYMFEANGGYLTYGDKNDFNCGYDPGNININLNSCGGDELSSLISTSDEAVKENASSQGEGYMVQIIYNFYYKGFYEKDGGAYDRLSFNF